MFVIYENVIRDLREFVSGFRKEYGTSNVNYKLVERRDVIIYFNLNVKIQRDCVMKMQFSFDKEARILTLYKCNYQYIDDSIENVIEALNDMTIDENHITNIIDGISNIEIK